MEKALSSIELQILDSFEYHAPTPTQQRDMKDVRKCYRETAALVLTLCPPSADRTAALRLLHESMMTANKSIVLADGLQPPRPPPAVSTP
jgi:hypothetical protein